MSTRAARAVLELVVEGLDTGVAGLKAFDQELKKAGVGGLKGLGNGLKDTGMLMTALVTGPIVAVGAGLLALSSQAAAAGDAIGNSARTAGVSAEDYQELAFAMDQVSDVGEEQLTKALSKITTELGQAEVGNKQAIASLRTLGFTQKEIASGTLTTAGVFERLGQTMQGAKTDAQAAAVAGKLLGDKLGPVFAGALRASGGEIDTLRERARALGIVMSDNAVKAAGALKDQLDTLKIQVSVIGREIGGAFMPVLRDELIPAVQRLIPIVRDWVSGIADAIKWFRDLPGPVQAGAVALVGIVAAAGPVLFVFGQLATSLSSLIGLYGTATTASSTFAVALRGLSVSALGVAGAIGLAAGALLAMKAAADKNNIATNLSDAEIRKEITSLQALGGTMATSRAAALEAALAKREHARAAEADAAALEKMRKSADDAAGALKGGIPPILDQSNAMKAAARSAEQLAAAFDRADEAAEKMMATIREGVGEDARDFMLAMNRGFVPDGGDLPAWMKDENAGRFQTPTQGKAPFGDLPDNLRRENVGLFQAPPAMASMFAGLKQAMSTQVGPMLLQAFSGGGNPGQAVGGLIGGQLVSGIAKNLSAKLGGTIGSAFGSAIPVLGTLLGGMAGQLIGPLIGKVGQFFKEMFGGPSQQELEGRQTAASFRQGLLQGLDSTQMLEVRQALKGAWAGNEIGAATVIAVRDAYIKAGKSAEEALAIVDRLWRAEKEGGEAVKDVLAEIRFVFDQNATAADDFGNTAAEAFDKTTAAAIELGKVMAANKRMFGANNDSPMGGGSVDLEPKMFDPESGSWVTPTFEMWEKLNPGGREDQFRAAFGLDIINAWKQSGLPESLLKEFLAANGDPHRVGRAFNLPGFAEGGVAMRATAGIFGERGPEMLRPLDEVMAKEARSEALLTKVQGTLERIRRDFQMLPSMMAFAVLTKR